MNSRTSIRIATRKSPLALWQANFVKKSLEAKYPQLTIELLELVTVGDQKLETSLAKIGGKGLFVKELENALLNNEADIAVHSLKDIPAEQTEGLALAILCEREDPRDVFVSSRYASLADLPLHSIVGTASLRRQCQLLAQRPDLQVTTLRGNVQTRLDKLDREEYAAIILAAAGLKRLQLEERIREYFDPTLFIPAVGQGVIGIECRSNDHDLIKLLQPLDDANTRACITAERAMNLELKGGCQVPIGIYATFSSSTQILLRAMVGIPDGSLIIKGMQQGLISQAEEIGKQLAYQLLQHGADKILQLTY